MSPAAGTTRYLCPLECGWHHDRPPFPEAWIPTGAFTPIAPEAIQQMASHVLRQDVERVETALREHLATHTTEEFVRTIQGLRAKVQGLTQRRDGLAETVKGQAATIGKFQDEQELLAAEVKYLRGQ